jgi:hypothetical protein
MVQLLVVIRAGENDCITITQVRSSAVGRYADDKSLSDL